MPDFFSTNVKLKHDLLLVLTYKHISGHFNVVCISKVLKYIISDLFLGILSIYNICNEFGDINKNRKSIYRTFFFYSI